MVLLTYYLVANSKPIFKDDPSISGNPTDGMILDNCVFENFTLIAELFAKPYKYWKLFYQLVIIHLEN